MWWREVAGLGDRLAGLDESVIAVDSVIEPGCTLDDSHGPIAIGARTRVCAGAVLRGPLQIGADCLVGNGAMIRGPAIIGDHVSIGLACEIKQSLIGNGVSIGPMSYIGDSKIDDEAYLGAMVRTSNHRLDGKTVNVLEQGKSRDTGLEKLGCWIGNGASLGIQVITLPGRVIAAGSLFEPRVTIDRNYPPGRYRLRQVIETVQEVQ